MITKKQYAWASHAIAILYQGGRDADVTSQDLIALIESLRAVARAARYFLNGNWDFKEGSDAYDRHEMLIDAINALPAWVLEKNGSLDSELPD